MRREGERPPVMAPHLNDKSRTPAMFDTIAHRYDLLNHLLSFNVDRHWRHELVAYAGVRAGERVLDVATGTGDVAIEFARTSPAGDVLGVDLATRMLAVGREKLEKLRLTDRITLHEADALSLPFEDASFDIATIAFGLRNLPDYRRGVAEMARVLRPGGRVVVLEFVPPKGAALVAYRAYLSTFLPLTGRLVSGSREAYRYFAASVRAFISEDDVRSLLSGAGLARVESRRVTCGIAGLYRGVKS
jgi:demethylmenaquinone methyltransferase/2-methoxy-6-polyprenyl-1,4-benzoquinol methylase